MRWKADWWGIVLIPESEADASALHTIPKKPEETYEYGEAEWEDDPDAFGGKALVLNR